MKEKDSIHVVHVKKEEAPFEFAADAALEQTT